MFVFRTKGLSRTVLADTRNLLAPVKQFATPMNCQLDWASTWLEDYCLTILYRSEIIDHLLHHALSLPRVPRFLLLASARWAVARLVKWIKVLSKTMPLAKQLFVTKFQSLFLWSNIRRLIRVIDFICWNVSKYT